MDEKPEVVIYCDGCCLRQGFGGGWGAVLKWGNVEKWFSAQIEKTTSQRAELIAVIEALKKLNRRCKVTLYSDSQVTMRCASGEYNRNSNLDLWEEFDRQDALHEVNYRWIRGHNGTPGNERAHQLAERAARGQVENS